MAHHKKPKTKHPIRSIVILVAVMLALKFVAHDLHEVFMTAGLATMTAVLDVICATVEL